MTDQYAVIGNPISHSLSPIIHDLFAKQTQQNLSYEKILAEIEQFPTLVKQLQAQKFKGVNITLPFKEQAFQLATRCTERAQAAKAVNTFSFFEDGTITGDNTDGVGFIRDLTQNLAINITNKRILIIGAGGAARGIMSGLLSAQPAKLDITNRTEQRALNLIQDFAYLGAINLVPWENNQDAYDLVINASSLSLNDKEINFPHCKLTANGGCYDLAYGKKSNIFLNWGKSLGAHWTADGMGMLIEQAAEAFFIWRGIRPKTQPVLQLMQNEFKVQ